MYSVSDETRKPIFEGVQGENEAREIQFDVTAWVEELGEGVCTATAKRPTDTTPYPVTVTRSGNVVTWKPNSTDTSIEGIGAFQLAFSINDVVAKTRIWNTKIAPSLVGAGDPPDPYDDWIQDLRDIAAETLTYSQNAANSADDAEAEKLESEAWAKGTKNGAPVSSSDAQYQNNSKYWAEQSLANQYCAFIVKSASGDIASFSDGADDVSMKSLNVTITPKQNGSGDPSPSNVRPITGTSSANVFVTGENLLGGETMADALVEAFRAKGLGDYYCTKGEDANGKYVTARANSYKPILLDKFKPNTQYTVILKMKKDNAGVATNLFVAYTDGTEKSIARPSQAVDTVETFAFTSAQGKSIAYIASGNYSGVSTLYYENCGIFEGVLTVDDFEPYTGHTTPVPLGQTVYGGEVDVTTGVLTITKAMVDLGTLNWSVYQSAYSNFLTTGIASLAKQIPSQATYICSNYVSYSVNGAPSTGDNYTFLNNNKALIIKDTAKASMTAADFKTAMSGVQLVYELATPTTVQLTPTQVATLLGTNNVWSDAGDIAVEYRADPTLAYAELQALILENI